MDKPKGTAPPMMRNEPAQVSEPTRQPAHLVEKPIDPTDMRALVAAAQQAAKDFNWHVVHTTLAQMAAKLGPK